MRALLSISQSGLARLELSQHDVNCRTRARIPYHDICFSFHARYERRISQETKAKISTITKQLLSKYQSTLADNACR